MPHWIPVVTTNSSKYTEGHGKW